MDIVGGPGILPRPSRAGAALVVALGRCGGITAAVPWISLPCCPWLMLMVGPHYPGYVAVSAGPGFAPLIVVPV